MQGADVVRVGDKTYTLGRALALGYVVRDANGTVVVTEKGMASLDVNAQKAEDRRARAEEWRRSQGLDPLEPVTTADGQIKPARKPKVLKPRNVTKTGEEVTDAETLEKIAAETAAIEKAHLARLEAGDGQ